MDLKHSPHQPIGYDYYKRRARLLRREAIWHSVSWLGEKTRQAFRSLNLMPTSENNAGAKTLLICKAKSFLLKWQLMADSCPGSKSPSGPKWASVTDNQLNESSCLPVARPYSRVSGAPVNPCATTEEQATRLTTCHTSGSPSLCSINAA
jgi:hypothetical protein